MAFKNPNLNGKYSGCISKLNRKVTVNLKDQCFQRALDFLFNSETIKSWLNKTKTKKYEENIAHNTFITCQ